MRGPCRRGVPADVVAQGSPPLNRRGALRAAIALGAGGALWWGVPAALQWARPAPEFLGLPLPGFRLLRRSQGAISLLALPAGPGRDQPPPRLLEGAELCTALFPPGTGTRGALFVDPQCAICRTTTPGVEAAAAAAGMPLREHLLTGLGAASEVAARAMLAARVQGREAEMRMRLSRAALVTNAAYVEAVAREIGVDPLRLARDMMSPEVDAELDQAARLAASFGISGTPAMVIGRTVVIGAMRRAEVAALIDMERAEVAPGPCG